MNRSANSSLFIQFSTTIHLLQPAVPRNRLPRLRPPQRRNPMRPISAGLFLSLKRSPNPRYLNLLRQRPRSRTTRLVGSQPRFVAFFFFIFFILWSCRRLVMWAGSQLIDVPCLFLTYPWSFLPSQKHRLSLLRTLQAHVTRESALRSVEKEMTLQRNLMGKGSKKKISPGGRQVAQVGDDAGDDDEEDERGGRKGEWKGRTFKWKAERRK